MNRNLSRRGFLQSSLGALTFAGLPARYARELLAAQEEGAAKKTSAGDRLAMGIVGVGSPQSRSLQVVGESRPPVDSGQLTFLLGCDAQESHRRRAVDVMRERGFKDFEANTKDFREIVNNKSLDCVLVATPDHSPRIGDTRNLTAHEIHSPQFVDEGIRSDDRRGSHVVEVRGDRSFRRVSSRGRDTNWLEGKVKEARTIGRRAKRVGVDLGGDRRRFSRVCGV